MAMEIHDEVYPGGGVWHGKATGKEFAVMKEHHGARMEPGIQKCTV